MKFTSNKHLLRLSDGNDMPREFFGSYSLQAGRETHNAVLNALRCGYRGLDTAALYRNESDVGRAICEYLASSPVSVRSDLFIQGKIQDKDQGYEQCLAAFDSTITLLQIKYLDSYLIHSPRPGQSLVQDTWRAMTHLQKTGRVRSIGVSNFDRQRLMWLIDMEKPAINQVDCSPFNARKELVAYCRENQICFQGYAPLTRGKKLYHPLLIEIGVHHNVSPAQILLKWAESACDSFVVKSKAKNRIFENFDCGSRPHLSSEDRQKLSTLHNDGYFVMGWNLQTLCI